MSENVIINKTMHFVKWIIYSNRPGDRNTGFWWDNNCHWVKVMGEEPEIEKPVCPQTPCVHHHLSLKSPHSASSVSQYDVSYAS